MSEATINEIKFVNIAINTKCTCRCRWCSIWRLNEIEMSWRAVVSTTDMCNKLGVDGVIITGGEASLHSNFINILDIFRNNFRHVLLCTDGSSVLPIIEKVHGFIDAFLISMDGHNNEIHKYSKGVDNYEDIIRMIYRAKELNPFLRIQVSHLIQNSNYRHLEKFYYRIRQLPVDLLSIVMPNAYSSAFGHEEYQICKLENDIYKINLPELEGSMRNLLLLDEQSDYPILVQNNKTLDMYINYIKTWQINTMPSVSRVCNVPRNSITILPDGTIQPCFYLSKNFSSVFSSKWRINRKTFLKHFYKDLRYFKNDCKVCALFSC